MKHTNSMYGITTKRKRVKLSSTGKAVVFLFVVFLVFIAFSVRACVKHISDTTSASESAASYTDNFIDASAQNTSESASVSVTETTITADILSGIYSNKAVVIDCETGTVVKGYNAYETGYPASVTKIMTAIIAIENIEDLDETVVLEQVVFDTMYGTDLSAAGFEKDEEVSYRDLLYGLMMRSGGECCYAIALSLCDSEEAFAELMNQKAEELGLANTHFTNCTGEHDDNHYSTVYDMATLMNYCIKNDTFREISSAFHYVTSPTNLYPDGHEFYSTLYYATPDMSVYADRFTLAGGKTGYTSQAGQCLITYGTIGGREYIVCTFGAYKQGDEGTRHLHAHDHLLIYTQLAEALGYTGSEATDATDATADTAETASN